MGKKEAMEQFGEQFFAQTLMRFCGEREAEKIEKDIARRLEEINKWNPQPVKWRPLINSMPYLEILLDEMPHQWTGIGPEILLTTFLKGE